MKTLKTTTLILGLVLLGFSPLLYTLAWLYQSTFKEYQEKGYERKAKVVEKQKKETRGRAMYSPYLYYVELHYYDDSDSEKETLYGATTEINSKVYEKIVKGDSIAIVLLPKQPYKPLPKMSIQPENFVILEKYTLAHLIFSFGLVLLSIYLLVYWKSK